MRSWRRTPLRARNTGRQPRGPRRKLSAGGLASSGHVCAPRHDAFQRRPVPVCVYGFYSRSSRAGVPNRGTDGSARSGQSGQVAVSLAPGAGSNVSSDGCSPWTIHTPTRRPAWRQRRTPGFHPWLLKAASIETSRAGRPLCPLCPLCPQAPPGSRCASCVRVPGTPRRPAPFTWPRQPRRGTARGARWASATTSVCPPSSTCRCGESVPLRVLANDSFIFRSKAVEPVNKNTCLP